MSLEIVGLVLNLPVFAMVLSRLGGMIMWQPVLGGMAIPVQIRAVLVIGLATLVSPLVPTPETLPDTGGAIALALASEILLGVLIGMTVRMCFMGLQIGAQVVAQEAGLAFGRVADPSTGENQSVFSIMYVQLAAVVFLIVGGHRVLLALAIESFETIPLLGDRGLFLHGADLLVAALTQSFEIAIRTAAPTVLALFLVNIALGFVSRTVPQLNVIMLGFSIKSLVALVLLAISLPAVMEVFLAGVESTVARARDLLGN